MRSWLVHSRLHIATLEATLKSLLYRRPTKPYYQRLTILTFSGEIEFYQSSSGKIIIAGSIIYKKMGGTETSCQKLEKMSILYQECIKRKNLPNCYHGRNHRQRSAASRLRNPHSCTYNFFPRTTFIEIHIFVIYISYPTSPQKKV